MERPSITRAGVAACLCLALAQSVGGCAAYQPNLFVPRGQGAQYISTLAYTVFAILSLVLVTVWALLAVTIAKDRHRPEAEVTQTAGNLKIEIVMTGVPVLIVAALFALTLQTMAQLDPVSSNVRLTAVGQQWWWELIYTQGRFHTANEIHLPVDVTTTAALTSDNVIHSFWVPQLGGKVDMIPGQITTTTMLPVKAGTYLGECAEFCGLQHSHMRFLVIVQPHRQFTAWFANQTLPARRPVGSAAVAGSRIITALPCAGCHTIRGTSMKGVKGPDLTHVGGRRTLAAVTLTNTPANMRHWIGDPEGVKPGTLMPRVPMPRAQLAQIVSYLQELK